MESLPVPSVQAMVARDGEAEIPVIDLGRLLDSRDEAQRLHGACKEWGFFQLVNHGVSDELVEGIKAKVEGFFQSPAETKNQFAQERGQLEGYGQLFVVSEHQKLDWADLLYLNTQPAQDRNMRFWPADLRWALDKYSTAVKDVADRLLAVMSRNLGLELEVIAGKCAGGIQSVRMNYYPPCAQAHKVVGFSPHSDADLLTLVLQVNEVQGLQIKRSATWVPVKPLQGAFVVNLGDIFEIFTNSRYKSVSSTGWSSTRTRHGCPSQHSTLQAFMPP